MADIGDIGPDMAWDQFEHSGDDRDLEEVIRVARRAVGVVSAGTEEEVAALSNLGAALLRRSERSGQSADLDEATEILRRAVGDVSAGTEEEVAALSNLGAALLRRSERTGQSADLDEATEILRRAVSLSPSNGPQRDAAISSLGDALRRRIEETRDPSAADQTEQFRKFVSEAAFVYEEVVTTRTRVLGADHLDTLASMNNLAAVLQDQGELEAAKQLHERVVTAARRVLGEDHPNTLASLNNLAAVLQDQGDLDAARSLYEQVLEARRRLLGDDHPSVLASMNNLATVLQDQGDLDAARSLYEQVLEARRRLLSDDHPDTLTSINNLVAVLHRQGDARAARALQEHVLATIAAEQTAESGMLAALGDAARDADTAGRSHDQAVPGKRQEAEDHQPTQPHTATAVVSRSPTPGDLVERVRRGDAAAWDALVERYALIVTSVVRRYGLGRADADDVGQAVWLRLVENIDQIREPERLPAWLATTAQRECLRLVRTQEQAMTADVEGHAEVRDLNAEVRNAALRDALQQLPTRCRQLLLLLAADPPPSYTEISASLGIPIGSIGPQRARCLARLNVLLKQTMLSDQG